MFRLARIFLIALLVFATSQNAMAADCGSCPGDHAGEHDHGDKGGEVDKTKAKGCESCTKGKSGEAVWCSHCKVGYVEGKKMKCEGCFNKATGKSDKGCESCSKPGEKEE
ncbi:MAG: hypothetical protein ACPGTU_02685 [Myxococcota bacterium]